MPFAVHRLYASVCVCLTVLILNHSLAALSPALHCDCATEFRGCLAGSDSARHRLGSLIESVQTSELVSRYDASKHVTVGLHPIAWTLVRWLHGSSTNVTFPTRYRLMVTVSLHVDYVCRPINVKTIPYFSVFFRLSFSFSFRGYHRQTNIYYLKSMTHSIDVVWYLALLEDHLRSFRPIMFSSSWLMTVRPTAYMPQRIFIYL